jgi:hypothetical protein
MAVVPLLDLCNHSPEGDIKRLRTLSYDEDSDSFQVYLFKDYKKHEQVKRIIIALLNENLLP